MMLGNIDDAMQIYYSDRRMELPSGWSRVGSGEYRRAYRCPAGLVYKVASFYETSYSIPNVNDEEYLKSKKIVLQGRTYPGWRVPPVTSYCFEDDAFCVTVNVSEFVTGVHEKGWKAGCDYDWADDEDYCSMMDLAFAFFDLYDAHPGNYVLTPSGERVIIDFAS